MFSYESIMFVESEGTGTNEFLLFLKKRNKNVKMKRQVVTGVLDLPINLIHKYQCAGTVPTTGYAIYTVLYLKRSRTSNRICTSDSVH
jgi:hypothetical protein